MDIESFQDSPVGSLTPARGHDNYLDRDYDHVAFVPNPLPAKLELASATYKLASEAERAIGRLDAGVHRLPDPSLLVRPALRREAVATSALEGTYSTLEDVLQADFIDSSHQSAEVREIYNYVRASELAFERIKERPISLNLIAPLQKIIVTGTRGDGWDAGRLRESTVYIGERHLGIEASRFVPPPPGDVLKDGVSDWEKWINADDDIPLLVKAALGHYQFETLHPFSDGNGRLGRLIVALQLVDAGALRYPILNLSSWLEARKQAYKDALLAVSRTGDFDQWIQFFCTAVRAQADDACQRIDELQQIRQEFIETVRKSRAKGVILEIVEDLIGYPVITATSAAQLHGVTYPPANAALKKLEALGIVKERTGGNYGRVYGCERVMRVVDRPSR